VRESVRASELAPHDDQHALGALLAGGTASQGSLHARRLHHLRQDPSALGNFPLEGIKTVEVERWLRSTEVADGTKAKIKCVMSAFVFSRRSLGILTLTIPSR
jgi:hypothetical protein